MVLTVTLSVRAAGFEDLNRRLVAGRGIEDSLATPKSPGFEDLYRLAAGSGIEDSLLPPTGSPMVSRT